MISDECQPPNSEQGAPGPLLTPANDNGGAVAALDTNAVIALLKNQSARRVQRSCDRRLVDRAVRALVWGRA